MLCTVDFNCKRLGGLLRHTGQSHLQGVNSYVDTSESTAGHSVRVATDVVMAGGESFHAEPVSPSTLI